MNRLEQRKLRSREAYRKQIDPGVRAVWKAMPEIREADVVVAALSSGRSLVLKGEEILEYICETGATRSCRIVTVPLPSVDHAEALRGIIAEEVRA